MRVKLCFDSFQHLGQRKKVCFFVGEGTCKKVADLNYLIQRRFFSNSPGLVTLFVDEFFIPPGEDIGIIHENDILKVQFTSEKKGKNRAKITNGADTSESETTASSSDSEEENVPAKKKRKAEEANKPIINSKKPKKVIPLSKLAITKKESSSSSSDTTDSSDSETDSNAKNIKTGKKETSNSKQKASVTISSDTTSSSSESNDETSKDETVSCLKETTSKVDFHVSGLSASTPGANFSAGAVRKSILKSSSSKENSFGKRVAAKDRYKNVSQVFTYTPDTTKDSTYNSTTDSLINDKKGNVANKSQDSCNFTRGKQETSTLDSRNMNSGNDAVLIDTTSATSLHNSQEEKPISGRTLRNRRRRQRRIAKQREQEPKNEEYDAEKQEKRNIKCSNVESLGNIVQDVVELNGQRNCDNNEVQKEDIKKRTAMTTKRNYEALHPLVDCPNEGSAIAFKLLEMDDSYQPFVSEFKEGVILCHNKETGEVQLRLRDGFSLEDKRTGRFEMEAEENTESEANEDKPDQQRIDMVTKAWKLLLQPRLIESEDFEF